jgi:hypothetical protein
MINPDSVESGMKSRGYSSSFSRVETIPHRYMPDVYQQVWCRNITCKAFKEVWYIFGPKTERFICVKCRKKMVVSEMANEEHYRQDDEHQ